MGSLLPVGTIVRVTERGEHARPPYVARVVGYDMGRTKYQLGRRFMGWSEYHFTDGGTWAFPHEVQAVEEERESG